VSEPSLDVIVMQQTRSAVTRVPGWLPDNGQSGDWPPLLDIPVTLSANERVADSSDKWNFFALPYAVRLDLFRRIVGVLFAHRVRTRRPAVNASTRIAAEDSSKGVNWHENSVVSLSPREAGSLHRS
jgi:hypothetical protein